MQSVLAALARHERRRRALCPVKQKNLFTYFYVKITMNDNFQLTAGTRLTLWSQQFGSKDTPAIARCRPKCS